MKRGRIEVSTGKETRHRATVPKSDAGTYVDSGGGDVAFGGSVIDKRSGGNYSNESQDATELKRARIRKGFSVYIAFGVIVSTVLGLLSNIVAAYLQQQYGLLQIDRFWIVSVVFVVTFLVSVAVAVVSK